SPEVAQDTPQNYEEIRRWPYSIISKKRSCPEGRFHINESLERSESLSTGKVAVECCTPYRIAFAVFVDHLLPGGIVLLGGVPDRRFGFGQTRRSTSFTLSRFRGELRDPYRTE